MHFIAMVRELENQLQEIGRMSHGFANSKRSMPFDLKNPSHVGMLAFDFFIESLMDRFGGTFYLDGEPVTDVYNLEWRCKFGREGVLCE